MRFFEDGPDIPDQLIEARENGEVVFFCGAGISIRKRTETITPGSTPKACSAY